MRKITAALITTIIFLSACHSKAANEAAEKDSYEITKETLAEKEKKNPLQFLKVTGHDKHNLIGQMVVKGSVSSSASVCVYKDVELELGFYSKTAVLLEKDNETIYEEITPGNSVDFKTKYYAPKGTNSVAIKIVSAKSK